MGRFAILAVCTANICRSPLIESLLRHQLDPEQFEVASAGTHGWDRAPMDSMAAMELMRIGWSAEGFQSHPLDSYLVQSADLILTATKVHRAAVLDVEPQALRRTFTLREFASLVTKIDAASPRELVAEAAKERSLAGPDLDIDDPYRRSPAIHRRTADQIEEAVATIVGRLHSRVA